MAVFDHEANVFGGVRFEGNEIEFPCFQAEPDSVHAPGSAEVHVNPVFGLEMAINLVKIEVNFRLFFRAPLQMKETGFRGFQGENRIGAPLPFLFPKG